jgi:hypothetical protein
VLAERAPEHGSGCSDRAGRLLRWSVADGGRQRGVPVAVAVAISIVIAVAIAVTIDDPNGPEGGRGTGARSHSGQ